MTQPARTSQSHPLRIDSLPCSLGRIGITFCPGKKGPSSKGTPWDRDLDLDLEAIRAFGASSLVSLIEDFEFDLLRVPKAQFAARAGELFTWYHLPIVDVSIPDAAFEEPWTQASFALRQELARGGTVVFHCRGGLGRAGMMAARLLIDSGVAASEAIQQVRTARPGAIETRQQEAYLLAR